MEIGTHYSIHTGDTLEDPEYGTVPIRQCCMPLPLRKLLWEEWVDWQDEIGYQACTEYRSRESDHDLGGTTLPEYYLIVLYESGCCPNPDWPKGRVKTRPIILPDNDSESELFLVDREGGMVT